MDNKDFPEGTRVRLTGCQALLRVLSDHGFQLVGLTGTVVDNYFFVRVKLDNPPSDLGWMNPLCMTSNEVEKIDVAAGN